MYTCRFSVADVIKVLRGDDTITTYNLNSMFESSLECFVARYKRKSAIGFYKVYTVYA